MTEYAAGHCFACPFGYRMKLFLIEDNGRGVNSPSSHPAILTEQRKQVVELTTEGLSVKLIDVGVLFERLVLRFWDGYAQHWPLGQASGNTNAPAAGTDNRVS